MAEHRCILIDPTGCMLCAYDWATEQMGLDPSSPMTLQQQAEWLELISCYKAGMRMTEKSRVPDEARNAAYLAGANLPEGSYGKDRIDAALDAAFPIIFRAIRAEVLRETP